MSGNVVVNLYGRIFVRGDIQAVTGLHIGRGKEALEIGGVDNPVIRDPLTNRPYIPGSSLKGKMRSLWEKMTGVDQHFLIGRIKGKEVRIHVCEDLETYQKCPVCPIYGVPGDKGSSNPTRLVVRDVLLSDDETTRLEQQAHTDLPYTEVKWEAAIDRVTSAATPRPMERVPADTLFEGLEIVFSVYDKSDLKRFLSLFEALQLLEDDYLGGLGSRGSGKILLQGLTISCRDRNDYASEVFWEKTPEDGGIRVSEILAQKQTLLKWLEDHFKFEAYAPANE